MNKDGVKKVLDACGRPPAALTLRFKEQGRVIVLIGPA
jgi:hypothetical protein